MTYFLFVICTLATWRITHLLQVENGPYNLLFKARSFIRRRKGFNLIELIDCFLCLSIWIALPFSLLFDYWYITVFALSGGAILIEYIADKLNE